MRKKNWVFVFFFVGVFLLELLAHLVTYPALECWYKNILKPSFTPPNWVFGSVWIILYILIAWTGATIWNARANKNKQLCLIFWFLQMGTNALWCPLFFGCHQPFWGAIDITLMISFVLLTLIHLKPISKLGFYSFLLYLGWSLFAGILNWTILFLNRPLAES